MAAKLARKMIYSEMYFLPLNPDVSLLIPYKTIWALSPNSFKWEPYFGLSSQLFSSSLGAANGGVQTIDLMVGSRGLYHCANGAQPVNFFISEQFNPQNNKLQHLSV